MEFLLLVLHRLHVRISLPDGVELNEFVVLICGCPFIACNRSVALVGQRPCLLSGILVRILSLQIGQTQNGGAICILLDTRWPRNRHNRVFIQVNWVIIASLVKE